MQPHDPRGDGRPWLATLVGECVALALIVFVLGLILMPIRSRTAPPRVISVGPGITITYSESELWIAVAVAAALVAPCLLLLARHIFARLRARR